MFRYEYKDTTSTRLRQCKECLKYNSCLKYTRKFNPEFGECMDGKFPYKRPEINNFNVRWYLLQIKRDIMYSESVAESLMQSYRLDSIIFTEKTPTFSETEMFLKLMKAFQLFLIDRDFECSKMKSNYSAYIALVNSIIDTKMKVEGNEVMVYSRNERLIETLTEVSLKNKFKFRTIATEEEANSWWVPITRENFVTC